MKTETIGILRSLCTCFCLCLENFLLEFLSLCLHMIAS